MPINSQHLSREIKGRLRQFYRLLLSYSDFKQAKFIVSYIIEKKLHNDNDRRLLEALNCSMIVSYCRPFSGNDKRVNTKIPDLPKRFLKNIPDDELLIHNVVIEDRNKYLTHSESEASGIEPYVWEIGDDKILMPSQYDRLAPLNEEATETFERLVNRIDKRVLEERFKLEPELIQYFKSEKIEDILNR